MTACMERYLAWRWGQIVALQPEWLMAYSFRMYDISSRIFGPNLWQNTANPKSTPSILPRFHPLEIFWEKYVINQ